MGDGRTEIDLQQRATNTDTNCREDRSPSWWPDIISLELEADGYIDVDTNVGLTSHPWVRMRRDGRSALPHPFHVRVPPCTNRQEADQHASGHSEPASMANG